MTRPCKVLLVHNYYRSSSPSGETAVFEDERRLLQERGHEVVCYTRYSDSIRHPDGARALGVGIRSIWNDSARREMAALIEAERPDVAHIHNSFPLISPSVLYALRAARVPVVHTLHNYRLICAGGNLERQGAPCERCVGRLPIPAVTHGCYRDSRAASIAVATSIGLHRGAGTWSRLVDAFIAPSRLARATIARGGIPAGRIHVVPHFVAQDPGPGRHADGCALFVGRLSAEKGIETLLSAWERIAHPLRIIGDGPLAPRVADFIRGHRHVRQEGLQSPEAVASVMSSARVLVFPSHARETFGRVVIEAFAAGTPVIASDAGSAAEIVDQGKTGVLVPARDPASLADAVNRLLGDPTEASRLGDAARTAYEARFTPDAHYRLLLRVYEAAIHRAAPGSPPRFRWEALKGASDGAEELSGVRRQPDRPGRGLR